MKKLLSFLRVKYKKDFIVKKYFAKIKRRIQVEEKRLKKKLTPLSKDSGANLNQPKPMKKLLSFLRVKYKKDFIVKKYFG
ncbi:MAG: hypothetical protein WCY77_02010 [Weeksellaceae bacterium]